MTSFFLVLQYVQAFIAQSFDHDTYFASLVKCAFQPEDLISSIQSIQTCAEQPFAQLDKVLTDSQQSIQHLIDLIKEIGK